MCAARASTTMERSRAGVTAGSKMWAGTTLAPAEGVGKQRGGDGFARGSACRGRTQQRQQGAACSSASASGSASKQQRQLASCIQRLAVDSEEEGLSRPATWQRLRDQLHLAQADAPRQAAAAIAAAAFHCRRRTCRLVAGAATAAAVLQCQAVQRLRAKVMRPPQLHLLCIHQQAQRVPHWLARGLSALPAGPWCQPGARACIHAAAAAAAGLLCRRWCGDGTLRPPALPPIRAGQLQQQLPSLLRLLCSGKGWEWRRRQQQSIHLNCHTSIEEVALPHHQACGRGQQAVRAVGEQRAAETKHQWERRRTRESQEDASS